jgi:hypothetical protein
MKLTVKNKNHEADTSHVKKADYRKRSEPKSSPIYTSLLEMHQRSFRRKKEMLVKQVCLRL